MNIIPNNFALGVLVILFLGEFDVYTNRCSVVDYES